MKINISAISDVGIERTNNEDAILVCPDIEIQNWGECETKGYLPLGKYGSMTVVADGMGGANAGEIASSIAIETVKSYFSPKKLQDIAISDETAYCLLSDVINQANMKIMNHVLSDPDSIGLGTTIVISWIVGGTAYIAWCGDSRCYCFNQHTGLRRLTKDHSLVQELIDKGELSVKKSFSHPDSNVITRCLGDVDAIPEPDLISYRICDGDIILSCSDGLCGYCDDKNIEKTILNNFDDLSKCRDSLLDLALKTGGQDNISIALCSTLPDEESFVRVSRKTKVMRFLKKMF